MHIAYFDAGSAPARDNVAVGRQRGVEPDVVGKDRGGSVLKVLAVAARKEQAGLLSAFEVTGRAGARRGVAGQFARRGQGAGIGRVLQLRLVDIQPSKIERQAGEADQHGQSQADDDRDRTALVASDAVAARAHVHAGTPSMIVLSAHFSGRRRC
jgi:hypothetical protein